MHHGRQQHRDRKRGRVAERVGVAWGVERRFAFGPSYEEQQEGIAPKPIPAVLQEVFKVLLEGNIISPEEAKFIIHPLQSGDYFRVCADFDDYVRAQEEMQELWKDQTEWTRRSIETVAGMGKFSSDTAYVTFMHSIRSIAKYCQYVWEVRSLEGTATEVKRTRSFPRLNSIPKDLMAYH